MVPVVHASTGSRSGTTCGMGAGCWHRMFVFGTARLSSEKNARWLEKSPSRLSKMPRASLLWHAHVGARGRASIGHKKAGPKTHLGVVKIKTKSSVKKSCRGGAPEPQKRYVRKVWRLGGGHTKVDQNKDLNVKKNKAATWSKITAADPSAGPEDDHRPGSEDASTHACV